MAADPNVSAVSSASSDDDVASLYVDSELVLAVAEKMDRRRPTKLEQLAWLLLLARLDVLIVECFEDARR